MTSTTIRTNGLHHAISLGNIETTEKSNSFHVERCYDSEDENMGRRRARNISSLDVYPRTSVYSKGDIREQYCLTDRQLNTIEQPRRERFFGCFSSRGAPQSFLGVCVGRRAPSDENIADYAPFYKYPRYHHNFSQDMKSPEDESSYFRRQPASILITAKCNNADNASNRFSWIESTSSIDDNSLRAKEQGVYRCPAHVGLPPPPPPPTNNPISGPSTPRTKHVSFARSHTLTSFDEASLRSSIRMKGARSQERLIGGKKPIAISGPAYDPSHQPTFVTRTPHHHVMPHSHQHPQIIQQPAYHIHHPNILIPLHPHEIPVPHPSSGENMLPLIQVNHGVLGDAGMSGVSVPKAPSTSDVVLVEKIKRNAMKTQATQTECYPGMKRDGVPYNLALSPRTIHRVKVVSQGAQTNGFINGRKLTKSLSEMPNGKATGVPTSDYLHVDKHKILPEHEHLHRTQSEEPPRSPSMVFQSGEEQHTMKYYEPPPPINISSYLKQVEISDLYSKDLERKESQDSATSYKATDSESALSTSGRDHTIDSSRNVPRPRSSSQSLHTSQSLYGSGVEGLGKTDNALSNFDFERNSLPRRSCGQHRLDVEAYSHSLPRREHIHAQEPCRHITECPELLRVQSVREYRGQDLQEKLEIHRQSWGDYRRSSMMAPEKNEYQSREVSRRQSMPMQPFIIPFPGIMHPAISTAPIFRPNIPELVLPQTKSESTTKPVERQEEQEIFIDFKPHMSPKPSPKIKKKLIKTVSDGEILIDRQRKQAQRSGQVIASTSGEDILNSSATEDDEHGTEYLYQNFPIKDEGICEIIPPPPQHVLSPCQDRRDRFRKRSISLDDQNSTNDIRLAKSAPPSPGQEEMLLNASTYPSSDSLANDITRDHSDGIWDDSQVTVLTVEPKDHSDNGSSHLLTPSSKRKNLLLQHQQRSSIDIDAIDFDDQISDQSPTYLAPPILTKPISTQTPKVPRDSFGNNLTIPVIIPSPSIAVTPTSDFRTEDPPSPKRSTSTARHSPALSSNTEKPFQSHRFLDPPIVPGAGQVPPDVPPPSRRDSAIKINNDISECSTNTDEYITCTDTSKRTPGIKTPPTTTSSSSTTQVPVSAQSSQTERTHDGSSFESASSLYSTRGDGLSEEVPIQDETFPGIFLPTPSSPRDVATKASPCHSISSTSSGSYNIAGGHQNAVITPLKEETSTIPPKVVYIKQSNLVSSRNKVESVSDDERSEKRYSSSGYYESPPHAVDAKVSKLRRYRVDEERRRRKTSMKIDIERENLRALTSPIKKANLSPNLATQVSPEKQETTNIDTAEGTSPSKIKRFRPKIRRQFRRLSKDESVARKSKIMTSDSPYDVTKSPTNRESTAVQLKAKSTESLRSVSPGSDSVFYSEADQQVHCLFCGKEVDIFNASESQESVAAIDQDGAEENIVKPPSDFADSPVTTKTSHRLYKKMDKRFRSEERHGDRSRHYKSRQENIRAKSEERSKDSTSHSPPVLRPAGSSPCVLPNERTGTEIYRGIYDYTQYTHLTESDVYVLLSPEDFDRRRIRTGSTESEKNFCTRYELNLHRMIQRKCVLAMNNRQETNTFKTDKTIIVTSETGEFGFRIHGSKPIVVAAIEPDTPAEISGLQVGDIIIAVNGVPVLDKNHTEVVRIAHAGCDTLAIEVARAIRGEPNEKYDFSTKIVFKGYLWRRSATVKNAGNTKAWVRRWFCLRSNSALFYYKTERDTQPVGATILIKKTIERCDDTITKPFAFAIKSPDGSVTHLAADTDEMQTRWMKHMRHAANQHDSWLEKRAKHIKQPPSGIDYPECYGYLNVLGSRWCNWSKKYCVLKDAGLYFYQDVDSKDAFGMACLQGYKVVNVVQHSTGEQNVFEIIPPDTRLRHFVLSAKTEADKIRWVAALEFSIDRWFRIG